jgi:hypothetical protein
MRLRARRSTAVLKHSWRLFAIAIVMGGDWLGGALAQQAAPADQAPAVPGQATPPSGSTATLPTITLNADAKPLTVRFDVVNLFDAVYEIRDGSGIGVFAPQYGARRGFLAGVSQKF